MSGLWQYNHMPEAAMLETFLQDLGPWLWWGGLLFGLLLYAVFSAILVYHWKTYAIGADLIQRTFWWYFTSTGVLIIIAVCSLLWATV